jgi:fructose-bisphosphate aldolase class II
MGANTLVAIARSLSKEHGIPVFVNLDHAEKLEDCMMAIEAGYDLIHFDGSHGGLDENIRITKEVVKAAHAKDLIVEAEIDALPTKSSEIYKDAIPKEVILESYSDPESVKAFAAETGVDTMATVFGNVHGILLQQEEELDFDLVARIREVNPDIFLSMHGSSGIPEADVTKAIKTGKIVKVNISTEVRKAFRETLEQVLKENPDQLAVYKFMPPVIEAIKEVAKRKIEAYGSAGKV